MFPTTNAAIGTDLAVLEELERDKDDLSDLPPASRLTSRLDAGE
jgi:hypothetical protein